MQYSGLEVTEMSASERKLYDAWMLEVEVRMLLLAKRCGR